MGKNGWKSNKMSEIWEKMGNPILFERVMGPNRQNMENYGDLQPIVRSMKPTLWVPSENLSFGLLPYCSFLLGKFRQSFVLESVPSRCNKEKEDSYAGGS